MSIDSNSTLLHSATSTSECHGTSDRIQQSIEKPINQPTITRDSREDRTLDAPMIIRFTNQRERERVDFFLEDPLYLLPEFISLKDRRSEVLSKERN